MRGHRVRVVFDCFGTLISDLPETPFEEVVEGLATFCRRDERTAARMVNWINVRLFRAIGDPESPQPSTDDLVRRCLERYGVEALAPARHDELLLRLYGRRNRFEALPGASEAWTWARRAGGEVAVLSNSELPSRLVLRIMRDRGYPVEELSAYHFSGDGGPRKPQDAAFRTVEGPGMHHVMIGDSHTNDLDPARKRNWAAIRYPSLSGRLAMDLESALADTASTGRG